MTNAIPAIGAIDDATQVRVALVRGQNLVSAPGQSLLSANVLDEDDMASDSATKVPSQQSVKAYTDQHTPFALQSDADGATIDSGITHASTVGYATIDDGGGAEFAFTDTDPDMPGGWSPADGRFAEIIPAARYKPSPFGILPEDDGAAALIDDATEWMWRRRGGGIIEFLPEKYYITATIHLNYSNLQWIGCGSSWHSGLNPSSPWDQAKGTRFGWTSATADNLAIVRPLVDSSGPALVGVGIENIVFDCAGVATCALNILSTRGGRFSKLAVTDAVTTNMNLGVVADGEISSSDPRDLQHNHFDQIFSRSYVAAAADADGIVITGDNVANASLNTFGYLNYFHKNGDGLVLKSSDNFIFEHVEGFRSAGGTGAGVHFIGGSDTADNPRNHTFVRLAPGAGGVSSTPNTTPPVDIDILIYSRSNGTPAITPVQGVDVSWREDARTELWSSTSQLFRKMGLTGTPVDGLLIAEESAWAFDDGGTFKQYTGIVHRLQTKTAGAHAGQLFFETAVAGTLANRGYIGAGMAFPATVADKGAGTINMGSGYYLNGTVAVDAAGGINFPSYAATAIAAIGNAVNTANKAAGKAVFDTTNGRIMIATGSTAASTWKTADGATTVTPA